HTHSHNTSTLFEGFRHVLGVLTPNRPAEERRFTVDVLAGVRILLTGVGGDVHRCDGFTGVEESEFGVLGEGAYDGHLGKTYHGGVPSYALMRDSARFTSSALISLCWSSP